MSEYRVECKADGASDADWRVVNVDNRYGPGSPCWCLIRADAERIARALAVLDAMEERDTQITEAMQDMAEDEPAVPQARGEG